METDKQTFSADKPVSCKYCYYWLGKKKGCELENCYYLIREKPMLTAEELAIRHHRGNCSTCPYRRASPCIGYCIEKILLERKTRHESR